MKTVLFLAALAPTLAVPQAGGSAASRLDGLGPENARIAGRVGLWDVTETFWSAPGAKPRITTGLVAERRMVGSVLQEFLRPPSDAAHRDVRRTDLLTYNRLTGRWDYVSYDARVPVGLMPANSANGGSGSSIELTFAPFAIPRSGKEIVGQMLRMDQIIHYPSTDRDSKDQYFTLADGTGTRWLAHRYAYVRHSAGNVSAAAR